MQSNGSNVTVYVHQLEHGQDLEQTLHRLRLGAVIRFVSGASLYGRRVSVFTNHPAQATAGFQRHVYRRLDWHKSTDTDTTAAAEADFVHLPVVLFGAFRYYFTYDDGGERSPGGSGCFVVDPVLCDDLAAVHRLLSCSSSPHSVDQFPAWQLPLDAVQCLTVISKCLGPLDQWLRRLQVAHECRYNVIHFTPVQALGSSNSAYSLSDQLTLNPAFNMSSGRPASFDDLASLLSTISHDWQMLSVCDVVLNHTSNDSAWLRQHPECAYNMLNSGHLRPAYLLDRVLDRLSKDMLAGVWQQRGLQDDVTQEQHLQIIRDLLYGEYLPPLRLHEFFQTSVARVVDQFTVACRGRRPAICRSNEQLQLLPLTDGRRHGRAVCLSLACRLFYIEREGVSDTDTLIQCAVDELAAQVRLLNDRAAADTQRHLTAAVDNIVAGIRYERLAADGPRMRGITWQTPLAAPYFTTADVEVGGQLSNTRSLSDEEEVMFDSEQCQLLMAHNGWVMGDDPLSDFARADCLVYFRRELVAWGDSVKLRYGQRPDDCPYLWQHMQRYVEQVASLFHGVRLDNCHSTPLHVAEYMLDAARRVRPNLYVIAELFTNNDRTDNVFVNRLGINSLIREGMSAADSHELGRLVYLYGGEPVGSFTPTTIAGGSTATSGDVSCRIRPLVPSRAHALLFDQTHDNQCPLERRSVFDQLPSAVLVSAAGCAIGSCRGYDELVPHHVHVVNEKRLYTSWSSSMRDDEQEGEVSLQTGIMAARQKLNQLHKQLAVEGFTQVFVDQVTTDIVTVTRHNPLNHQSYVFSVYTAFSAPACLAPVGAHVRPIRVQGSVARVVLQAALVPRPGCDLLPDGNFVRSAGFINGLCGQYQVQMTSDVSLEQCSALRHASSREDSQYTVLEYDQFTPGSVVVLRIEPSSEAVDCIERLRCSLPLPVYSATLPVGVGSCLAESVHGECAGLTEAVAGLSLVDLNHVLFRCAEEERDGGQSDVYVVPRLGPFVYSGLQSVVVMMADIDMRNDLGHPLCDNLRQGDWLMDYIVRRLLAESTTRPLGLWLQEKFGEVAELPRYLVPCYFNTVVQTLYVHLLDRVWRQMNDFVRGGCDFVRRLALGSVQMAGVVHSAPLPDLCTSLHPPRPPLRRHHDGSITQMCASVCAGLPHFSTGYMRNWGRDTFISLRGLLLLTGRHSEARHVLLAYAGCLRHGLVPNLLDGGRHARYNCRDSVWWWLYCVQEYVGLVDGGVAILQDQVSRIFPTDDSPPVPVDQVVQSLEEVIQEAMQRHFVGVSFRERNAGKDIDRDMSDAGFNNRIGVDLETGFVFGGSEHNCGTWMDKMGSSVTAGNAGCAATPRDGSAVELVALCRSAVGWLATMHQAGHYHQPGVSRRHKPDEVVTWTWQQWADKIDANFERHFYIGVSQHSDPLVQVGGMYKDSLNATQLWADYQLRCNYPVAMVVAPQMFNPDHAWTALQTAGRLLLGPLGMRTLHRHDWAYCGHYNNEDHSDNPRLAHGFNYHNGPEWVWPVGYFVRALLHYARLVGGASLVRQTVARCQRIVSTHYSHVCHSVWRSLPELTNADGEPCRFSCDAQAWSMGCLLEAVHDIEQLLAQQPQQQQQQQHVKTTAVEKQPS